MKNFRLIIVTVLAILCISLNSCKKNFLDKAPGVDLTEETLFTSVTQLDKLITEIYKFGLHSQIYYGDASLSPTQSVGDLTYHPTSDLTDESDLNEQGFGSAINWNQGTISPSNIASTGDNRYYTRFTALRQIAILLKNIDKVPNITPAYKAQVIAEVKSIRAFMYLEMVKRYGGVPIITEIFEPGVTVVTPRNTIEECFNFIVQECDAAISSNALPDVQSTTLLGRITSLVPYAIKSRALLYAASPMFNTATPYLAMSNPANNNLICYGNYDVKRWEVAAAAALAGLQKAQGIGTALVFGTSNIERIGRYPGDIDPLNPAVFVPLATLPTRGNYELSWSIHNNPEIILTFQAGIAPSNYNNNPWRFIAPTVTGPSWSGLAALMNHVRKYEKLNGTPQTWPTTGTNLAAKNRELDPRFKQTLIYNNCYYSGFQPIFELSEESRANGTARNSLGHWMRKMLPINIRPAVSPPAVVPLDIILRLNELYLNYAEAKNEADPSAAAAHFGFAKAYAALDNSTYTANIYDAVNVLRARSGMPTLPLLSQSAFRDRVRNERAIEMAFDDHRMWDIRRWLIAEQEGVMKGLMEGMKITRNGGTSPNFNYDWQIIPVETRTFNKNMYLHPFPLSEFQKGGVIQNPGW
ncbi:RagB/SusD family nutrient uptake outer membrane protein [Pedobacter petrophilus]|uniref:RagB/SusD family nutrient uptake outer membrane protein n=1 Tax=Pedobacter petrophilus TaxID=1908241 RepID=A0A7K0G470_9SPHI|nr:RagB/SusD family nutrient uptake outer membrane protein [Pedobacter petrophilus]MRX78019.1 RagB/SusD family nutrient uptake outer membrane protein [Pedobacter petrophilus]